MNNIESSFLKDYSLKKHNSWLVGGCAEFAFFPSTIEQVGAAIVWSHSQGKPITLLGQGSNVLISDRGVPGLVMLMERLSGFQTQLVNNKFLIEAMAGTLKSDLLKFFIKERLSPAVFLAGLPGDLAGGVVMNAGVSTDVEPKEFVSLVDWVEVVRLNTQKSNFEVIKIDKQNLKWSYRKSEGWQPGIIVRVGLSWSNNPDDSVLIKVREGNTRRKSTQPLNLPSCGSVFKNPEGDKAGRLIEQSGLKGFRIGDAQVSEKHANFIVNLGEASSKDIDDVIKHVQITVFNRFGIKLTNEVKYLGDWN